MTTPSQAELPKTFQAESVEPRWLDFWQQNRLFHANPEAPGDPFVIVIPPPNVTGVLHMGHGMPQTIQDILTRFHRMNGRNTLWVPGTDHAGIATQHVVAESLRRGGREPREMGRDAFVRECWAWTEKSRAQINGQVRSLGGSCDWSRDAFTMDATRAHAVRVAFKHLFDKGLIYRGLYLVNWDPVSLTALSDDEVDYEDETGTLYHIRYPFADGSEGGATVATTRPETLFGDVAVAVHPSDERYKGLVGREVTLPLAGRRIPIIADGFVKTEFGTGMVKITPAHDPNDFDCGRRLGLEMPNIFTDDAKLNEIGGEFAGLDRFEARRQVIDRLKSLGLLLRTEQYATRVGRSYRSKAIIEPRLSEQWFVRMRPMAEKALDAVRKGDLRIVPDTYLGVWNHWMENVRDWCISRQLWWGHRIPIWYRVDDPSQHICWDGEGDPPEVLREPNAWRQDTDVLDTWFSSALWPFSVMGWPTDTADLRRYYPTSVLVTGHDILFFWVARMVMMGIELTGTCPFHTTFLHGLIFGKNYYKRDGHSLKQVAPDEARELDSLGKLPAGYEFRWEKMSKSKGNVIDPLEMGRLYGMDAVRWTLAAYASQGRTIDLDRTRFESSRNLVNKLWNASRFVFSVTEDVRLAEYLDAAHEPAMRAEDKWILAELSNTTEKVTAAIQAYEFDQYTNHLYNFFWKSYCDWYIEMAKQRAWGRDVDASSPDARAAKVTLLRVLEGTCRLMAPCVPFAAEEIWQLLRQRLTGASEPTPAKAPDAHPLRSLALCVSPWPRPQDYPADQSSCAEAAFLQEVVTAIRAIRGEMSVPLDMKVDIQIEHRDAARRALLERSRQTILNLVNGGSALIAAEVRPPGFASTHVAGDMTIFVPLPEKLRVSERARLEKELQRVEKGIDSIGRKLSLPSFLEKAPQSVVEQERAKLAALESEAAGLREKVAALGC